MLNLQFGSSCHEFILKQDITSVSENEGMGFSQSHPCFLIRSSPLRSLAGMLSSFLQTVCARSSSSVRKTAMQPSFGHCLSKKNQMWTSVLEESWRTIQITLFQMFQICQNSCSKLGTLLIVKEFSLVSTRLSRSLWSGRKRLSFDPAVAVKVRCSTPAISLVGMVLCW